MPKHTKKEKEKNRKRSEEQRQQSIPPENVNQTTKPENVNQTTKPEAPNQTQEFVSVETGKPSGITTPSGRTFFGLSPDEVEQVKEQQGITPEIMERAEQFRRAEDLVQQEAQDQQAQQIQQQPQQETEQPQEQPQQIQFGGEIRTEEEMQRGLLSGSVRPVTSSDLSDLAMLATGVGVTGVAAKATLKTTGRRVINTAVSKSLGVLKGFVGAALIGGVFGGVAGAISKDILEGGATEEQGALNTLGQLAGEDLITSVRNGIKTPQQARNDINAIESEINRMEQQLKEGFISGLFLELTGQMNDINADILDAKEQVRTARDEILLVEITDPDAVELATYIENLRKKYGVPLSSTEENIRRIQNE